MYLFRLIGCLIGISALHASLRGEIQQATLSWTPGLCKTECIRNLEKELRMISSVKEVRLNDSAGQASILFKSNIPFSMSAFEEAMRSNGLSIISFRLRVKGEIVSQGPDYVLISSGDNTSFTLINPIVPERDNYIVQYNISSKSPKLSPTLIKQIEDNRNLNEAATIEGPLLFPERAPPLLLVIESAQFGTSKPPKASTDDNKSSTEDKKK